jgi:hypothetical protein
LQLAVQPVANLQKMVLRLPRNFGARLGVRDVDHDPGQEQGHRTAAQPDHQRQEAGLEPVDRQVGGWHRKVKEDGQMHLTRIGLKYARSKSTSTHGITRTIATVHTTSCACDFRLLAAAAMYPTPGCIC